MIYMGTHLFSGVESHCCEDQVCYEGGGEVKEACKQVNMDRRMTFEDCLAVKSSYELKSGSLFPRTHPGETYVL